MHKTIDIDGLKLHYDVEGSGPSLILMHGWGCRAETVTSIAKTAARTHTVYSVDFPGFGDSPEPDSVWGVEEYTRLIERFAEILNLESPTLIGHSFGGRVAILFASRRSVDKLILVDAAGIKPHRSIKYYFKVYSFKALKKLAFTFLPENKAREWVERKRKASGSSDYASASPTMRAILSKVVNEDLSAELPKIKAPTLLIWGENDTATPLRDAKKMERLIPDAGLVIFPNCGHYSFLDNPLQFALVLSSFLNS